MSSIRKDIELLCDIAKNEGFSDVAGRINDWLKACDDEDIRRCPRHICKTCGEVMEVIDAGDDDCPKPCLYCPKCIGIYDMAIRRKLK